MPKRIRPTTGVVSFDLDGTLWDFAPMMDGALAAAIVSLERHHPDLAGKLTAPDRHRHRGLTGRDVAGWVHVGDEIVTDVAGAQRYGMIAVWLNRGGAEAPVGVVPDAEIASLHELPDLVDRLLERERGEPA